MARFFKAKDERQKEEREVAAGKAELTQRFLDETEEGRKIKRRAIDPLAVTAMTHDPEVQKKALQAFLSSPEGKKYASMFDEEKKNTFKPPEGFSNVVGVGANPVMEKMTEAIEVAKEQLVELKKFNFNTPSTQVDFTKKTFQQ